MKTLHTLLLSSCLLSSVYAISEQDMSMNFTKETSSLIRHLQVYKNPTWAAKVVTKSSKEFYFVSPKSLLEYYFNPEKWPKAQTPTQQDIKALVVTDYTTLKPIDASKAYYVYGSNITSPAGDDLPSFKKYGDALEFANKYNGKRIMEFKEVSKALIELLNGDI